MRIVEIKQTTKYAPSQWEGRLDDGRPVYIRYRWGTLSVQVGRVGSSIQEATQSEPIFEDEVGEKMGSFIELNEALEAANLSIA